MIQEIVVDRLTVSPAGAFPGQDLPVGEMLPLLPPRLVDALTSKGFVLIADLVAPHRQAELLESLASWQLQQLREALDFWPLQHAQDLRGLGPLPEDLDWYEDWDGEDDWDFMWEDQEEHDDEGWDEDDEVDEEELEVPITRMATQPDPESAVAV